MNDFHQMMKYMKLSSSAEELNCQPTFDILIERFLSQYSKERYSSEMKEQDEKKISPGVIFPSNESGNKLNLGFNMWHSMGPIKTNDSNLNEFSDDSILQTQNDQHIDGKAKMVYEMLSELKMHEKETIAKTFLVMTTSPECCAAIKRMKCLPILVGLIHDKESNKAIRELTLRALQRIVQHNSDSKQGPREILVFKLIEQIINYCEQRLIYLKNPREYEPDNPIQAVALLMKFSFDEEHRRAMCELGALHTLATLLETDHEENNGDILKLTAESVTMRRYAAMALTNLTFKDSSNKALLCSFNKFMQALVSQLRSPNEDLCQVTASVLRNLSWRADTDIKRTLREIQAVAALMKTALRVKKESTLKAVLSALWNLSAHSNSNKVDICNVDGSIEYLVKMLNYQAPSGTLTIVENIGGILRNVSSLIAVHDEYRAIIRKYNCLYVLLHQLKSPSLTIVSNACGTLWNLSARCIDDQQTLIQLGAVDMLRSLIHSKHKMISVACSAALKNLLHTRTDYSAVGNNRDGALIMRKRRNLEQELDANSQESCGFCKMEEPYNIDDTFGDYAETDLDQPTNYSLRFREPTRIDTERCEMMVTGSVECSSTDKKAQVVENTCLETPLMFSRSSSLGSVSSCSEQGDDQGSVVSEFSHAVSGVISPSELPASPSETVPPSPRSTTKNNTFYLTETKPKLPVQRSVFEDSVTVFKDENTPNQFSVATSLSSLTFEDEPHLCEGLASVAENSVLENQANFSDSNLNIITEQPTVDNYEEKDDSFEVELSPEEEQAVLNACIDSGQRSTQNYCPIQEKPKYSIPDRSNSLLNESNSALILTNTLGVDSTINYCTEDTPISISHAASNSDLSLLCPSEDSFLQNSILPLSSCVDEDIVELSAEEQEKLLNICIAKGQSLNYNSNDSIDLGRSSQSSTLSEITEDLPIEDKTLIKDMTESANLVTTTFLNTENDCSVTNDADSKELSDEQSENLLNQCIALGMRNTKNLNDGNMRDISDLENIGPPSFLAEANLDSSLTNVEEISDYPPGKKGGKCTPKQKRHQFKERYNTYTIKLSPTKSPQKSNSESLKRNSIFKEKSLEKDRFKTRTLSKKDFEEIDKLQENNKSSKSPSQNGIDETNVNSDYENLHDSNRGKTLKSMARIKSGIPVVKGKQSVTKSPGSVRSNPSSELLVSLQRQNTFTKEESSGIPVRKNSFRGNSKPNTLNENNNQYKSAIPSRIKEQSPKIGRIANSKEGKSPDTVRSRWSVSDNNLNATNVLKASSNVSLNTTPMYSTSKVSPSASHSALPVRKDMTNRNSNYCSYKK